MFWWWQQKQKTERISVSFCTITGIIMVLWSIFSSRNRINERWFLLRCFECISVKIGCETYSPPRLSAWTIRGSALLPSRNSSRVRRSSWFLSIWSKILSTRFCGVFSSSVTGCWPCGMFLLWVRDVYCRREESTIRRQNKSIENKTSLTSLGGFATATKSLSYVGH